MQILTITANALHYVDVRSMNSIDVQLEDPDLGFLNDIDIKDIYRNVDTDKLLQEYDIDDVKNYLESYGYAVTS